MKHKILIVEDQEMLRKLVRMTLAKDSFEISEAEDGDSAWEAVQRVRPDLVLLDVMMPGSLDGYEICARVKKDPELSSIPVILLTARGQKTDLEQGERVRADAYLIKPFSPLQLSKLVDEILLEKPADENH